MSLSLHSVMPPRKCPLPLTCPESLDSLRSADTDCSACLLGLGDPPLLACTNTCSHVFHYDCISQWSSRDNSCPQCKRRFQWIAEYGENGQRLRYAHCKLVRQKGVENTEAAELRCEGCGDVLPEEAESPEDDTILCTGMEGSCMATFHGRCAVDLLYTRLKDQGYHRNDINEGFLHLYFACPYCEANGLAEPPPAKTSASTRKRKKTERRREKHTSDVEPPLATVEADTISQDEELNRPKKPAAPHHHASGFLVVDEAVSRATSSTPLPGAFKDASNGALADFLARNAPDPSRPASLANVSIYRQRRLARKAMRERAAAAATQMTTAASALVQEKNTGLEGSQELS